MIGDPQRTLCVGLMDDGDQPNARAVSQQYLLMGVGLISMLERDSGVDVKARESKEKFVFAHEYSHIIQNLHGLKFDYILPMLSTKIKEQHADCMAAYLMAIHNEIPANVVGNLEVFIQQLADSHIVGDHGTSEQRIDAFRRGQVLGKFEKLSQEYTLTPPMSERLVRDCAVFYRPTNLQR